MVNQDFGKSVLVLRTILKENRMFLGLKALEIGLDVHKGFRKDNVTPSYQHQISQALYLLTLRANIIDLEGQLVATLMHDRLLRPLSDGAHL